MTYVILFEIESNRPKHEVAANIRLALEGRGIEPSGIDVWKESDPQMPLNQLDNLRTATASGFGSGN